MSVSSSSAKEIANLGGSLEITEKAGFSSSSVKDLVRIVATKGGTIRIHAQGYSSSALKEFVKIGKGSVTVII